MNRMTEQTIWKYKILTDRFTLELPFSFEFLCLMMQDDDPVMWIKLDPHDAVDEVHFRVYGTGQPIIYDQSEVGIEYLDSVIDGAFVWHLFREWDIADLETQS